MLLQAASIGRMLLKSSLQSDCQHTVVSVHMPLAALALASSTAAKRQNQNCTPFPVTEEGHDTTAPWQVWRQC